MNFNFRNDQSGMKLRHLCKRCENVKPEEMTSMWKDGTLTWNSYYNMAHKSVITSLFCIINSCMKHSIDFFLILLSMIIAKCTKPKDENLTIMVHTVLASNKMDNMQLNTHRDFIAIFNRWAHPSEILSPNWMLYAIDPFRVTFVKLPKSNLEYQAKKSPFAFIAQNRDAIEIGHMPLDNFMQLSKKIGDPKGPVLFLHNSGRSGSTLLSQMLQFNGKSVSFAEVDSFSCISNLVCEESFGNNSAPYEHLLRAALSIECKNQDPDVMFVFKTRCFGNIALPIFCRALPSQCKQLYLYRKNINLGVKSMVRAFRSRMFCDSAYAWKSIGIPLLDRFWISGSCIEKQAIRAVRPSNVWEYGAVVFGIQYTYFLQYIAPDSRILKLSYEDLLDDTEKCLKNIFQHCNMRWADLDHSNIFQCLNKDSQENSPLSRKELHKKQVDVLPISVERGRQIARIIQLPEDFFLPEFKFDHLKISK